MTIGAEQTNTQIIRRARLQRRLTDAFTRQHALFVGVDLQERYHEPFLAPVYDEAQEVSEIVEPVVEKSIWVMHDVRKPGSKLIVRPKPMHILRAKAAYVPTYTTLLDPEKPTCRGYFAILAGVYARACVVGVIQYSMLPYGIKPIVCLEGVDIALAKDAKAPKSQEELRRIAQGIYGPRVGVLTKAEILAARDAAFRLTAA